MPQWYKNGNCGSNDYCSFYSRVISTCADGAAISAALSGAGLPIGITISVVSVANGYLTLKICGVSYSTYSTFAGAAPFGKEYAIWTAVIDAALTAAGL